MSAVQALRIDNFAAGQSRQRLVPENTSRDFADVLHKVTPLSRPKTARDPSRETGCRQGHAHMIEARPNLPMLVLYEMEKANHATIHSLMVRRDRLRHDPDERAYVTVSALLGMSIVEHPTLFKTLTPRRMAA